MPDDQELVKDEIATWLKAKGKDREWLAGELDVSKSTIDGWFSVRNLPKRALIGIRRLMAQETETPLIGDPEGNLVSFTLDEFERIEATRQRLHYESRPPMYRDAILAFLEADEATQSKITTMPTPAASAGTLDKAAETPISPLVTEIHRPVHYTPKKP